MKKDSVENKLVNRLKGFAEALKKDESISERFTCRTIVFNLQPTTYDSKSVLATRQLLAASQGVFAQFLGVSVKTVRSWEQGVNTPSDMACRFMDEIQMNPDYWRKRFRDSVVVREKTPA